MSCIRKFASLPQLTYWRNARLITTQAAGAMRASEKKDEVTHTGQEYDKEDYRNVRFTNATKIVNKNWAIDLIAEQPIIESSERVVFCTGGDEHLGHPKVYINLDKPGSHACGYCGLRFQKKGGHHH